MTPDSTSGETEMENPMTSQHTDPATGEGKIEDGYYWTKYRFEDCVVETAAEVKGNKFRLAHHDAWWMLPNDRVTLLYRIPSPSEQAAKDAKLLKLLKGIEWAGTSVGPIYGDACDCCPCCGHLEKQNKREQGIVGHAPDCEVAAQIAHLESLLGEPAKGSEA